MDEVADPEILSKLVDKVLSLRSNYRPWMTRAACRDYNPGDGTDPWFSGSTNVQPALNVCRTCPVQHECDEYAQEINVKFGIWGNRSQRSRRTSNQDPTEP